MTTRCYLYQDQRSTRSLVGKEVKLEKKGAWGLKSIFTIRHMSEIDSVEDYEFIATEWN